LLHSRTPLPPLVPPADKLHLVLVKIAVFMMLCFNHIVVVLEFLAPLVGEVPNLDSNTTRHGRGVNQAQVAVPELLPPVFLEHSTRPMPSGCWRRLILFVRCSAVIVCLLIFVGSATAPPVSSVNLAHVPDFVDRPTGHIFRNAAPASPTDYLLRAVLKLLEFAFYAAW
jgi:hypothetical protein